MPEKIKVTREIALMDFNTPRCVNVVGGLMKPMELSELNWYALDSLCDRFRKDVFEIAGIKDHKTS